MANIFILMLMSSLSTGLIMLIFCAADKKFGIKLLPQRRTLVATLMLARQSLMLAVASAMSFASDIFGTAKGVAEKIATGITDTGVVDTAVAQVIATEATTAVDSTVGVTVSYVPNFGTILNIIAWIWLAGIAVTALYKIVSYLRFNHNLKKSLTKCDFDAPVQVFTSPEASSPFLMGFFRSRIILPEKQMEREELELAIRHELIHHKRHDIQKKFWAELLKCINWFNPAFYVFASKLSEREIMQVMWETGEPMTASQLLGRFESSKGWKPQTLNTFLTRLVAKGYLVSRKRGNANVYSILISKAEFESQEASEFIEKNYGGSAKRLIAALVDSGAVSDEELVELKQWFSER